MIEGAPATWEIAVTWGDCDAAGVVFYPNYFRWFDAATHALLDGLGLTHRDLRARYHVVGTPLVDARSSFRAPASYGDQLVVHSRILLEPGRARFSVRHRISRGDTLICEGTEVRVWAGVHPDDDARLQARPIPPEVLSLLAGRAQ